MANSTMGVRLNDETRHRLEALGKARDRTPHYLMKAAVERFLDVEDALEAERQLVKSRWEKYELTGETVDHADVKAWAASLGDSKADASGSFQPFDTLFDGRRSAAPGWPSI